MTAILFPDRWELRAASRQLGAVSLDPRLRVRIPLGVRHQLGLDGTVVVSLAADSARASGVARLSTSSWRNCD
jgi:hypothetical protein